MTRRPGVVTAFVTAIDPQGGRVKVEYRAMEDNLASTWAPVAAPMSGGQRGQLFMPEVGDECLVAFENGNFGHPFVVGFLWNGEQTSPESDASNRVIVTPGGHQLRFEDRAANPLVRLKSNGGRELVLDDNPVAGKVEVKSGSHKITLDDTPAGTAIRIEAGMGIVTISLNATPVPSLSISAPGGTVDIGPASMKVTAAGILDVTALGAANITAVGAASINAAGAATINAGGAATISAATMTLSTGALIVNAGVSTFSGPIVAPTVVASTVVASTYTPGIGNLL